MVLFHVIDSEDPRQTLIEQIEDSGVVVRSWMHVDVPVEARLNIDHPVALDHRTGRNGEQLRWVMPSAEVYRYFDGNGDGRAEERRLAFREAARARGHDVTSEALLRTGLAHHEPTPTRKA